jgi:hypothetical protein
VETITSTSRNSQFRIRRKISDSFISTKYAIPEKASSRQPLTNVSESFSDYISLLHITGDLKVMVLPASRHYYYETKDLKKVKILVNVKQLNDIGNIRDFLRNVSSVMPMNSYFIGTFFDNKDKNIFKSVPHKSFKQYMKPFDLVENGISARVPFKNLLYNLIEFRFERYMTKTTVSLYLEEAFFKVLDMTAIQGFTYFCAQKIRDGS